MTRNNTIVLNRGDSYEFDLTIADENSLTGRYHLVDNDTVYFYIIYPNQPFEEAIITKEYTVEDTDEMGNLTISIDPTDTLDLLPGTYYYTVKVHLNHNIYDEETEELLGHVNRINTIINRTKLFLCE